MGYVMLKYGAYKGTDIWSLITEAITKQISVDARSETNFTQFETLSICKYFYSIVPTELRSWWFLMKQISFDKTWWNKVQYTYEDNDEPTQTYIFTMSHTTIVMKYWWIRANETNFIHTMTMLSCKYFLCYNPQMNWEHHEIMMNPY